MRGTIYLFIIVIMIGCSEEQHPIMTDDDRALSLLLDLNIANVAQNKYPTGLRDSIASELKLQICKLHDLEEQELDTVLWMMQSDFERYNRLYKQLVDTLKGLEKEFGSENNKPRVPYKQMGDSLNIGKPR